MTCTPDSGERETERRLDVFGTSVTLLAGPPGERGAPPATLALATAAGVLDRHQRALTRFDARSELSRLNRDAAASRCISDVTARAISAALLAAQRSGGLVDPTLIGPLEVAGYAESRVHAVPAPLAEALRVAPPRRPAAPRPEAEWRSVSVVGRTIRRPPGVRLDLGGTAKGLAADRAARLLAGQTSFAVDAGGDIVLGGTARAPRRVTVEHPLGHGPAISFELAEGAVATSGIGTRVWRTGAGFAHHLIDPATGRSAWTGVIQATAVAPTGLEAETLAKMALLSGPEVAHTILAARGGAIVLDDGETVAIGPLRHRIATAAA